MFREIKKKRLLLENRKPYPREITEYLEEINCIDWIYTDLRLEGSSANKDMVKKIVKGQFLIDVSVEDHMKIGNHMEVMKLAEDMAQMEIELDEKHILKFYEIIRKPSNVDYRNTNPVLLSLNYNPPHPSEIKEQMDILFMWMRNEDFQNNPILKAAYLHNKIIEIYPFEKGTEEVARMAMYYELISNGYPPVFLNLSEQEYYSALINFLKKDDIESIYKPLERAVYNKLEVMMQLTAN